MLIPVDQIDASEKRFQALSGPKVRTTEFATQLTDETLDADEKEKLGPDNIIGDAENMIKRKDMLESIAQEPVEFALERAIGNNDAVYSNFCELIAYTKQRVGRIIIRNGNTPTGHATGFM